VDNIYAEKQQRLLARPLYASWTAPDQKPFLALTNVGYFFAYRQPALVPDLLLALDAVPSGDLHTKEGHSYFQWLQAKPPDVIIEIVSDRRGGEDAHKMRTYARQRVLYYVIFDPDDLLGRGVLRAFALIRREYEPTNPSWLPEVGLGLKLWQGRFEGLDNTWLRWCDREGNVIPTGAERAEEEQRRAEEEHRRAEEEHRRAEEATARAERLAARLRELGQDPNA
jgi:Uma2 family endonuclease